VKALEGIRYFDARKRVRELSATPKPGASYASVTRGKPQMCYNIAHYIIVTQTCFISMQTDPTPVATSTASTSKAITTDTHSTSKPTTNAKSSKSTYSVAVASLSQKSEKASAKDNVNLTPL